jgi:hypothetical protein
MLLEAELGMGVKVAAYAGEIVRPAPDVVDGVSFHDDGC